MAGPVRHLRGHLRRSDAVAALLEEIERRERLLSTIRAAVPNALAQHCRQAALDAGRLTLFVDSPTWVDRLRFLSTQFVDALTASGVEVNTCRVRVTPDSGTNTAASPAAGARTASPAARACLEQAADALGDTELARSLRRLAHSCAGHDDC